ncbi:DUF4229 domain-containing protein [Microbacterium sp. P01]|uniref:DUF4229 domain-containing protein n=1 Tax=unclassified Microbacterium TaxID=2609290 RepID=UPI003671370F
MKLPPMLTYTVLRLLAFLVPFGVLMLFPVFQELYWLAAVFAALIGLSISLLFLRRPLADVSATIDRRRRAERAVADDESVEDAANDVARGVATSESPVSQPTNDQATKKP